MASTQIEHHMGYVMQRNLSTGLVSVTRNGAAVFQAGSFDEARDRIFNFLEDGAAYDIDREDAPPQSAQHCEGSGNAQRGAHRRAPGGGLPGRTAPLLRTDFAHKKSTHALQAMKSALQTGALVWIVGTFSLIGGEAVIVELWQAIHRWPLTVGIWATISAFALLVLMTDDR